MHNSNDAPAHAHPPEKQPDKPAHHSTEHTAQHIYDKPPSSGHGSHATEHKPVEHSHGGQKPADHGPAALKSAEHGAAAHRPTDHKPVEPVPAGHRPIDHRPTDHKPTDHKPTDHKPTDHKPTDHKPTDHKPTDHKPTDHKPTDHKPTDHKPTDHKPTDHKQTDHKPTDHKPTDHKPAEHKPSAFDVIQNLVTSGEKTISKALGLDHGSDKPPKVHPHADKLSPHERATQHITDFTNEKTHRTFHYDSHGRIETVTSAESRAAAAAHKNVVTEIHYGSGKNNQPSDYHIHNKDKTVLDVGVRSKDLSIKVNQETGEVTTVGRSYIPDDNAKYMVQVKPIIVEKHSNPEGIVSTINRDVHGRRLSKHVTSADSSTLYEMRYSYSKPGQKKGADQPVVATQYGAEGDLKHQFVFAKPADVEKQDPASRIDRHVVHEKGRIKENCESYDLHKDAAHPFLKTEHISDFNEGKVYVTEQRFNGKNQIEDKRLTFDEMGRPIDFKYKSEGDKVDVTFKFTKNGAAESVHGESGNLDKNKLLQFADLSAVTLKRSYDVKALDHGELLANRGATPPREGTSPIGALVYKDHDHLVQRRVENGIVYDEHNNKIGTANDKGDVTINGQTFNILTDKDRGAAFMGIGTDGRHLDLTLGQGQGKDNQSKTDGLTGIIGDGKDNMLVLGGHIFAQNKKFFGQVDKNGDVVFAGGQEQAEKDHTALSALFKKGYQFKGNEDGHARQFDLERTSHGEVFVPATDAKTGLPLPPVDGKLPPPIDCELRLGMLINKQTNEQIGKFIPPKELSDGTFSEGMVEINGRRMPLANAQNLIFKATVDGESHEMHGGVLGANEVQADGTLRPGVGGVVNFDTRLEASRKNQEGKAEEFKKAQALADLHTATTYASGAMLPVAYLNEVDKFKDLSLDAKGTAADLANKQYTSDQAAVDKMLSTGQVDENAIYKIQHMGDFNKKNDMEPVVRLSYEIENKGHVLEKVPPNLEVNGEYKKPDLLHPGKMDEYEINKSLLYKKGTHIVVGSVNPADGSMRLFNDHGELQATSLSDQSLKGSLLHFSYQGDKGKNVTVDWVNDGHHGLQSLGEKRKEVAQERALAELTAKVNPNEDTLGALARTKALETRYNKTLDDIVKYGVKDAHRADCGFTSLELLRGGPKEFVRAEHNIEGRHFAGPAIPVPTMTADVCAKTSGPMRLGHEHYVTENGKIYHATRGFLGQQWVKSGEACGELQDGYRAVIDGKQINLQDDPNFLFEMQIAGDAKKHRIMGLGEPQRDARGNLIAGGLIDADEVIRRSNESKKAIDESLTDYRNNETWGPLGWAVDRGYFSGREGQLSQLSQVTGRGQDLLHTQIDLLFNDGLNNNTLATQDVIHNVSSIQNRLTEMNISAQDSSKLSAEGKSTQAGFREGTAMAATAVLTGGTSLLVSAGTVTLTEGAGIVLLSGGLSSGLIRQTRGGDLKQFRDNAVAGGVESLVMFGGGEIGQVAKGFSFIGKDATALKFISEEGQLARMESLGAEKGLFNQIGQLAKLERTGQMATVEGSALSKLATDPTAMKLVKLVNEGHGEMVKHLCTLASDSKSLAVLKTAASSPQALQAVGHFCTAGNAVMQSGGFSVANAYKTGNYQDLTVSKVLEGSVDMLAGEGISKLAGIKGGKVWTGGGEDASKAFKIFDGLVTSYPEAILNNSAYSVIQARGNVREFERENIAQDLNIDKGLITDEMYEKYKNDSRINSFIFEAALDGATTTAGTHWLSHSMTAAGSMRMEERAENERLRPLNGGENATFLDTANGAGVRFHDAGGGEFHQANGQINYIKDAAGTETKIAYDEKGSPHTLLMRSPGGELSTYTKLGDNLSVSRNGVETAVHGPVVVGRDGTVILPDGHRGSVAHHIDGKTSHVSDSETARISAKVDALPAHGLPVLETSVIENGGGKSTTLRRDAAGQIAEVVLPDGTALSRGEHHWKTKSISQAGSNVEDVRVDDKGNVTVVYSNKGETVFSRDGSRTETRVYGENHALETHTRPNGHQTAVETVDGKVVNVKMGAELGQGNSRRLIETFKAGITYGGDGKVETMTMADGVELRRDKTGYSVYSDGNLVQEGRYSDISVHPDGTIARETLSHEDGSYHTVTNRPDGSIVVSRDGKLESVTETAGTKTQVVRDGAGDPIELAYGNGTSLKREADGWYFYTRGTKLHRECREVDVSADGSITKFDEHDIGRTRHADGTTTVRLPGDMTGHETFDGESKKLEENLAKAGNSTWANHVSESVLDLKDRLFKRPDAEETMTKIMYEINRLMQTDGCVDLERRQRWVDEALSLAAHPEFLSQGQNNTCSLATSEQREYALHPETWFKMLRVLNEAGVAVQADGSVINSYKNGEHLSLTADQGASSNYDGKYRTRTDGARLEVSQIAQTVLKDLVKLQGNTTKDSCYAREIEPMMRALTGRDEKFVIVNPKNSADFARQLIEMKQKGPLFALVQMDVRHMGARGDGEEGLHIRTVQDIRSRLSDHDKTSGESLRQRFNSDGYAVKTVTRPTGLTVEELDTNRIEVLYGNTWSRGKNHDVMTVDRAFDTTVDIDMPTHLARLEARVNAQPTDPHEKLELLSWKVGYLNQMLKSEREANTNTTLDPAQKQLHEDLALRYKEALKRLNGGNDLDCHQLLSELADCQSTLRARYQAREELRSNPGNAKGLGKAIDDLLAGKDNELAHKRLSPTELDYFWAVGRLQRSLNRLESLEGGGSPDAAKSAAVHPDTSNPAVPGAGERKLGAGRKESGDKTERVERNSIDDDGDHFRKVSSHLSSERYARSSAPEGGDALSTGDAPAKVEAPTTTKRVTVEDLTNKYDVRQQAAIEASRVDMVTGYKNFNGLMAHLKEACLNCDPEKPFHLIYLDIRRFKQANDCMSPAGADDALRFLTREIAKKIGLRPDELMSRPGGDEIAIVLSGDRKEAEVREIVKQLDDIRLQVCGFDKAVNGKKYGMRLVPADHSPDSTQLKTPVGDKTDLIIFPAIGAVTANPGDSPHYLIERADALMNARKTLIDEGKFDQVPDAFSPKSEPDHIREPERGAWGRMTDEQLRKAYTPQAEIHEGLKKYASLTKNERAERRLELDREMDQHRTVAGADRLHSLQQLRATIDLYDRLKPSEQTKLVRRLEGQYNQFTKTLTEPEQMQFLRRREAFDVMWRNPQTNFPVGEICDRYVRRAMERAIENPSKNAFSLIKVDIDNMKLVNDKNGHDKGNILMKHCADYLRTMLPADCFVGSPGGGSFVIIAPAKQREGIESILRRYGQPDTAKENEDKALFALPKSVIDLEDLSKNANLRFGFSVGHADFEPTAKVMRKGSFAAMKDLYKTANDMVDADKTKREAPGGPRLSRAELKLLGLNETQRAEQIEKDSQPLKFFKADPKLWYGDNESFRNPNHPNNTFHSLLKESNLTFDQIQKLSDTDRQQYEQELQARNAQWVRPADTSMGPTRYLRSNANEGFVQAKAERPLDLTAAIEAQYGLPTYMRDTAGHQTYIQYDKDAQIKRVTEVDESGNKTHWERKRVNWYEVEDGLYMPAKRSFSVSDDGLLIMTDAKGYAHKRNLDGSESVAHPSGGHFTRQDGSIVSLTDASGRSSHFSYDSSKNLEKVVAIDKAGTTVWTRREDGLFVANRNGRQLGDAHKIAIEDSGNVTFTDSKGLSRTSKLDGSSSIQRLEMRAPGENHIVKNPALLVDQPGTARDALLYFHLKRDEHPSFQDNTLRKFIRDVQDGTSSWTAVDKALPEEVKEQIVEHRRDQLEKVLAGTFEDLGVVPPKVVAVPDSEMGDADAAYIKGGTIQVRASRFLGHQPLKIDELGHEGLGHLVQDFVVSKMAIVDELRAAGRQGLGKFFEIADDDEGTLQLSPAGHDFCRGLAQRRGLERVASEQEFLEKTLLTASPWIERRLGMSSDELAVDPDYTRGQKLQRAFEKNKDSGEAQMCALLNLAAGRPLDSPRDTAQLGSDIKDFLQLGAEAPLPASFNAGRVLERMKGLIDRQKIFGYDPLFENVSAQFNSKGEQVDPLLDKKFGALLTDPNFIAGHPDFFSKLIKANTETDGASKATLRQEWQAMIKDAYPDDPDAIAGTPIKQARYDLKAYLAIAKHFKLSHQPLGDLTKADFEQALPALMRQLIKDNLSVAQVRAYNAYRANYYELEPHYIHYRMRKLIRTGDLLDKPESDPCERTPQQIKFARKFASEKGQPNQPDASDDGDALTRVLQNQARRRESSGQDDGDGTPINYRESGGLPENYGQGFADQTAVTPLTPGTVRKISLNAPSGQSDRSTENSAGAKSSPTSGNDIADMPQKNRAGDVESPPLPPPTPLPYELHQQMEAARLRERINPTKLYQKQIPLTGELTEDADEQ